MKKQIISVIIIYLFYVPCYIQAQSLRYPIAMPYTSCGAYSQLQQDAFSFTGNQAALAQAKQPGAGVYGERRFMLAELNYYAAAITMPTRMGNFGLSLMYSGFTNFNENKIGLAYGRSLGSKVDVGVQFNYYGYRVPAYGNASSINFEAGAIMHFTNKLHGGIHVYNPVGGKLGKNKDEKLAAVYKAGVGYDASDHFFINAEIIKEEDKPVNVVAGMQYHFAKRLFARGGFLSESTTAFAGVGIGIKNMRLDVSASYHPQLGLSREFLLLTHFGNRKE